MDCIHPNLTAPGRPCQAPWQNIPTNYVPPYFIPPYFGEVRTAECTGLPPIVLNLDLHYPARQNPASYPRKLRIYARVSLFSSLAFPVHLAGLSP
jgi:hypothetical protein